MSSARKKSSRSGQASRDRQAIRQRELAAQQAAQRRKDRRLLTLLVVAVVVVLVGAGIGFQFWRTQRAPDASGVAPAQSAAPVTLTNGQPISWGSADAPVTVDLYEDFHCPHCVTFEEQYGQLLADAQTAGQISLRIFPMSFIDSSSVSAANGFACAAEAGFGEAYYRGLFANDTLDWSDAQLNQLAEQVRGPVPGDITDCVAQRTHQGWVTSIGEAATAAGVEGTPTMFLNGTQVDIATLTADNLKTQIEEAAS